MDTDGGQGWESVLPALCAVAAEAVGASCWRLTDEQVLSTLEGLDVQLARLAAARLALIAEVDSRGISDNTGATGAGALLRERLRVRPTEASAEVRLVRDLARHPEVRDALAGGRISREHARVIVGLLRQVPTEIDSKATGVDGDSGTAADGSDGSDVVDGDVVGHVTETLLAEARRFDPTDLARIGRRILAYLDPDGPAPAERRSRLRREFSWHVQDDGSVKVWGRLDPEGGAALIAALDPLSAPRPYSDEDGADPRTSVQRRADALIELTRRALDAGVLPDSGGERPHVTVTISLRDLASDIGAGLLDPTGPISPETARRLACDAQIIPVVLGSDSQPLDIGRATRSIPTAIRRALVARDRGCAFPSCDRPPAWCAAHHIQHWAKGGNTALHNLVLLCGHHHRRIHHHGWHIRIGHSGHPEFAPPGGTYPRDPQHTIRRT